MDNAPLECCQVNFTAEHAPLKNTGQAESAENLK
jgi:hypothetical protein